MCFLALAKESRYVRSFDKTVKLHVAQQTIMAMMLTSLTETLAAVNIITQDLAMFVIMFKALVSAITYNNIQDIILINRIWGILASNACNSAEIVNIC